MADARPGNRPLPLVEPPFDAAEPGDESVAGVLLAAGSSARFGDADKLLATLDGEPLVRHAARTLAAAGLDDVIAVVGPDADRVPAAVDGLVRSVVRNPDAAAGQSTSVRAGVERVRDRHGAVLFALADVPRVDAGSVDRLVRAYRAGRGSALAAAYRGTRGNPVLFDERHFDSLVAIDGDDGGRGVLLGADDAVLVETGDPGVLVDVDTRADLAAVRDGARP